MKSKKSGLPEVVYRHRNLQLIYWGDNAVGKPVISISRGYRPRGANDFINLKLSLYRDNVPVLLRLLEAYLEDYPSASGVDVVIERKVFSC
jgi:hypothetical protein